MNDISWYDTAQICTNGHVINSQSVYCPERNKKSCDKCGAPTITNCQNCNAIIRGFFHEAGMGDLVYDYTDLRRPSFCHECGKPYPWTEAKPTAMAEPPKAEEEEKPPLGFNLPHREKNA